MFCDVCGKNIEKVNEVEIQGAILNVCDACTKFGIVKRTFVPRAEKKTVVERRVGEENTLVSGYGNRIKKARERRNLTQEKLARSINEKEGLLRRIENEEIKPSDDVIRKIENSLNIKITEKVKDIVVSAPKAEPLTLGDIITVRKVKRI